MCPRLKQRMLIITRKVFPPSLIQYEPEVSALLKGSGASEQQLPPREAVAPTFKPAAPTNKGVDVLKLEKLKAKEVV